MRRVIPILLILVAVYVAVCAAAYVFQRKLLYFPGPALPAPSATEAPELKPVTLTTADGLELTAWYAPVPGAVPGAAPNGAATIVHFHGNAGTIAGRDFVARAWLDAGFGVLLVEYRGYGGNPGAPTEAGLYADGRAALDFLDVTGVPPGRIILVGESLGGGVAVRVAAERARAGKPVGAVILEAPFTSVPAVAQAHYWFLPARWLARDRFNNLARVAGIGAPILIVHGARDRVVPPRFGRRLLAAAREPKEARWIDLAGHNDLHAFGAFEAEIDFARKLALR